MSDVFEIMGREQNPSLPLALAVVLRVADDGGSAPFGPLTVAYRELYLDLVRRAGLEDFAKGGTLSMDEVRRFLASSVLPRLVTEGLLESLPSQMEDASPVRVPREQWEPLRAERETAITRLTEIAIERLTAAESAGTTSVAGGSTLRGDGLTKIYRRRRVVGF